MKRTSSPEKSDGSDKKHKLDEERDNEEESGSVSQAASVDNGGGGEAEESQGTTESAGRPVSEEAAEKQGAEVRSSDTPKLTTDDVIMLSDDGATSSAKEKQEDEKEVEEIKEEEKSDLKDRLERWQLVPTTVRQRMNYLLTTSKLSDCTVLVGNPEMQQEFRLHSMFLCMSSPEFEDMLSASKDLTIPDVEPDIFKQILEYVYLDYVNLWSVEKTQALYRASVRFKLPHLCEKAVEYMMAKMSIDSIWPIFDAALATQDQILMDECNKFFKKNISDLLKHSNFATVNQSVISNLVSDDSLGVPEADLVGGVLLWSHQKCLDLELVPNLENKRVVLQQDIIHQLRFLALSREYFASNVAYNKTKGDESILTLEESYAILMNMVQPNSYPMPEGFSTLTKQRTMASLERLIRRVFNPLGTYQAVTPQSPRLDKLTVLPGPSLTAPFGCKSFSLDLTVSRNIILYGIQVPTFFPGMIGAAPPKMYEETYIVSIQNASKHNKPMIGSINWSGKVAYNAFVDLHFKESVRLEKNQTYTIMVYSNNTYYLNQKLCTVEDVNGVKFTLKDSVSLFGKAGKQDFAFISQLIFSL